MDNKLIKGVTVLVLKGAPCSGKTFYVENEAIHDENLQPLRVVNRDNLREILFAGKYVYTPENEKKVVDKEKELILMGLNDGENIIIDDTNLNPKTIEMWEELVKEFNKTHDSIHATIQYKEFYVSYETAITRSKARRAAGGLYIPQNEMLKFYKRYYPEQLREELIDKRVIKEPNTELPQCVICDLDATLALHTGRGPFEWDLISTDAVEPRLKHLLINLFNSGVRIVFVTGRNEGSREETEKWINLNLPELTSGDLKLYSLFMKPDGDFSHGDDYKEKVYHEHIEGKANVMCVFEDSNKCVKRWRELGLLTCQVANSDY